MKIWTYYDPSPEAPPHQAELIRLWERSWSAQGWEPRLLTLRHAMRHPRFKEGLTSEWPNFAHAVMTRMRGGWLVPPTMINYAFKPTKPRGLLTRISGIEIAVPVAPRFEWPGWECAAVVIFPESFSMQDILDRRAC